MYRYFWLCVDIDRQTDRDRWMMTQREKENERGSRDWSVSTVACFPLFVGVCGLFAVPNQCWNLLHSSPVPIHNTHIHINSYMHPLSPDASPSLPSLASKKTFPGKNETVLMTPSFQALRLFLFYHVSVSLSSFFLCNLLCLPLSDRFVLFIYWLWLYLNKLHGLAGALVISFRHMDFG